MVDIVFWVSLAAVVALIVFLARFSYRDWQRRAARRQEPALTPEQQVRKVQDEINARHEETKANVVAMQQKAAETAEQTKRDYDRLQRAGVIQMGTAVSSFGNRKQRRAKAAVERKKR